MRLALVAAIGCAVYPAPATFSAGTAWTFPLVDPLRDRKLLTAVLVEGRGPFLVALDPGAAETSIDREVVSDNWGETVKPRVDLENVILGNLTISTLSVAVHARDAQLDDEGRRIYGVIGRDVLIDTLAFGFDRDRGVAFLTRMDELHTGSAMKLRYEDLDGHRVVTATVNDHAEKLAVELGEVASQLRRDAWGSAQLDVQATPVTVVDRTGAHREVAEVGIARVSVGAAQRDHVSFVPSDGSGSFIGSLGLGFFQPYAVTAAWQDRTFYLKPRSPTDADDTARLARWGRQLLDACGTPGCVVVEVVHTERDDGSQRVDRRRVARGTHVSMAALAERPADVYTFAATRDPISAGNDLQVIVSATGKDGAALPDIEVAMPAGADSATAPADDRYAGATLKVIDVSPFPRLCGRGITGCIALEPSASP